MRMPSPRYSFGTRVSSGRDVEARLDREDHAGLERPRPAALVAIPPAVVDVEAEPVRRVMEREPLRGVLLPERLAPALQEAEVEERVEKDRARRLVGSVPRRAGPHGGDRRALGREDGSVQARLRPREPARGGKRPRHVGRVAGDLAARVHEDEVARGEPARVLDVVEDRRVLARGDDRRVCRAARAHRAEPPVDGRLDLVLEPPGPRRPLRVAVGRGRDRGGALEERDLFGRLHEAHRVEEVRRVGDRHGTPLRVPRLAPEAREEARRRGGRSRPRGRARGEGRAPCGRGRAGACRARRPGTPGRPRTSSRRPRVPRGDPPTSRVRGRAGGRRA